MFDANKFSGHKSTFANNQWKELLHISESHRRYDVVMNNDGFHSSIYWEGAQRRNKRARASPISSDGLDSNASPVSLIPRVLMKSSVSNLVSKFWSMSMPLEEKKGKCYHSYH
ncbi:hypothetical protein CTI12_AA572000 [Artemisia annua]|uniref:Uncharacterized protein n=1 Tax=Artemisia annua TaxID=35608 RepID=A0A2U1KMH7_ARTAN|nr:hypothetical protein CTI12_AA572000 [Artemisia annua]